MSLAVNRKSLFAFAESKRSEYEQILKEWVEIPSVSADPERKKDIRRAADAAAETVRRFGGKAKLVKTDGYPIVHGIFDRGRNLPTVTIYNHLDVQPASRETEPWDSEPFEFRAENGRYFGRGTTDDKGPALAALFGIAGALEADLPINLRVLWELEEEIGSPNFEGGIRGAGSRLATDSVLVSDTIWVARNKPACPAGLRGMAGFTLRLQTGETDVHSGTTGGLARNPLGELMKLVSQMYDAETGRVKVKGFYDAVEKPTRQELDDFRNSGFSVRGFRSAHGLSSLRTDDAMEAMKRLWAMPTFEVHGVVGGYTGAGIKTIIPPAAEVKISCRLVPNQDPDEIARLFVEFIREKAPDVTVSIDKSMQPYKAPIDGELADSVREAMRFAFRKTPVFIREGGSIGAVHTMQDVFECPVMFLGLSLPEHGYHAPNENFDWQQASGGIAAFVKYFELLSAR